MASGKRSSKGNRSGRSHAASRGGGQRLLIAAIAVTAIGVIAAGTFLFTGGSSESECEAKPLTVAASSALLPVVKQGAKALNTECTKLVAKELSTAEVLQSPTADLPDLWIADSPAPLRQFKVSGIYLKTVDPEVASSPVVLAGGPTAKAAGTWNEELSGGKVAMIDPSFNGPSAMVLTSPAAENPQITDNDLGKSFLLSAQRFGEASAAGQVQVPTLTDISATTTRLFPVSEQQLMASRKVNSQVTAITPSTGPLLLKYPLVAFSSELESYTLGDDLAKWFHSAAGVKALNQALFRDSKGDPMPKGAIVTGDPLPDVPDATAETALRFWRVTSVPSSLLAVLDVSGSMKFAAGDTTRLAIQMDAARAALRVFPDHARIGAWVFSEDQGGPGRPWKELASVKRLDAQENGRTHRANLLRAVDGLPAIAKGGTGLYTTTLAGYKQVLAHFDDRYFNSLILMTDGANDDPNSITLPKLIQELKSWQDPDKRVRIIAIGMSTDADMKSLTKIAAATGGRAYRADTPDEIIRVFQDALLSR